MPGSNNKTWRLVSTQPFELLAPDGREVKLAYRKLEELFCLLTQAPGGQIERTEIGEALWPTAALDKRHTNVRQAIRRLRIDLGVDMVVTNGGWCGFSELFRLENITDAGARGNRNQESGIPDPIAGFVKVLHWFSEWDPGQMFDLLRSNFGLGL